MADITAELDLEIAKFKTAMKDADKLVRGFRSDADKHGRGIGGALSSGIKSAMGGIGKTLATGAALATAGAVASGVALAAGLKDAFDLGGKFSDLSTQISTSAGEAMVLATAFEDNGMSAEDMTKSINKMQKTLVDAKEKGGEAKRVFDDLGLDPSALIEDDPSAAFAKIGKAIQAIEDPTERAARAMQIFGRSGGRLLVLFNDATGIEQARVRIGGAADMLNQNAAKFDRASDILTGVTTKVRGFFVGVGSGLIDNLLPMLEEMNALDLSGVGLRLGEALSGAFGFALAAMKELSAGEMLSLLESGLTLAFKSSVNVFGRSLVATFGALVALLSDGRVWQGAGDALLAVGNEFVSIVKRGLEELAILYGLKDERTLASVAGSSGPHLTMGPAKVTQADVDRGKGVIQKNRPAGGELMDILKDGARAWKLEFDLSDDLVSTSKELKELEGATARVRERLKQLTPGGMAGGLDEPASGEPAAGVPKPAGIAQSVGGVQGAMDFLNGGSFQKLQLDQSRVANGLLTDVRDSLRRIESKEPKKSSSPPPGRPVFTH